MNARAFSLVEIAIALGIFAFCLLAIMGLFTAGLKTEQSSQDEEGASTTLASLGLALENSYAGSNGTRVAGAPLDSFSWDPSSPTVTSGRLGNYAYWMRIKPVNAAGESRLVNALLEVAWPAESAQWDSDGRCSSARGTAETSLFFFLQ